MRFIHTSDWHLGRMLHGANLVEDQAHVLQQFVSIAKEASVDAVVIAGDLYDRAIPPTQAVSLCDEVFCDLALGLKLPVIIIAGNHDSAERVGFGGRLMAAGNVHIAGEFESEVRSIALRDRYGPVQFFALPYADPPFVRDRMGDAKITDHDSAMGTCVKSIRQRCTAGSRNVLVGHAFVVGGAVSESERPLSVGGAGTVSAAHFASFNYTALGHLHRPQRLGDGGVCFSGSLLKYSFDEASHQKSLSIVEIDAAGKAKVELVALNPRRDVRCLEGSFSRLLEDRILRTDDYVKIRLTDEDVVFEPLNRLREHYPNILDLDYAYRSPTAQQSAHRVDHTKIGPMELFQAFYHYAQGQELSQEQAEPLAAVIGKLAKEDAQ